MSNDSCPGGVVCASALLLVWGWSGRLTQNLVLEACTHTMSHSIATLRTALSLNMALGFWNRCFQLLRRTGSIADFDC